MSLSRLVPRRRAGAGQGVASAGAGVDAGLLTSRGDDDPAGEGRTGGGQETWTGGPARAAGLATGVLWCCLLAGPGALAAEVLSDDSPAAVPAPRVVDRSRERTLAGETAQAWVIAWLSTPRDRAGELERFYPGAVALPATAVSVSGVGVAEVVPVDGGSWSVTVGAEVTAAAPAASPDLGQPAAAAAALPRRYFRVPVAVSDGPAGEPAAAVLALPAPVPAPPRAAAPRLGYGEEVPAGSPLTPAVSDFLAAMVTGAGDGTRYTAPGTRIAPIDPPAARAVLLRELRAGADTNPAVLEAAAPRDGQTVRVLAAVELQDDAQQLRGAQYALTLTGRAGRWEVAALDLAPATAIPVQPPAPAPTTATSSPRPTNS